MSTDLLIRLGVFIGVFALVALWETARPRRRRAFSRGTRWPSNIGLLLVDAAVLRIALPGAAVAVAIAGEGRPWGLLHLIDVPAWLGFIVAIVLLDLALYFQHVTFHAVPALWRLHRVHHSDLDFDVTTGTRFHPIEILISMAAKVVAVAAIGAPPEAVLTFEILLNASSMFNHANAGLPSGIERIVRCAIVTPDMHRVHHSEVYNESGSNFGFCLPWWDRLFGTYMAVPAAGHEAMNIGVDAFRSADELRLDRLLTQPLRDTAGGYAINRRPEPTQS